MANAKHVFGSGKARAGAVGAALTDAANGIGDVQSMSLDIQSQKKELMNSPEISMFPVGVQYYGSKVEAKVNFENLDRNMIALTTGAVSSGAGPIVLTISNTAKPGYFKFEWQGQDVDGNEVLITLPNASAPGLNLAMALDDYTKSDITISAYPDPATGVVCTIQSAA
jgi:hypothetical protein